MAGKSEDDEAGTTTFLGGIVVPVDSEQYAHMKYVVATGVPSYEVESIHKIIKYFFSDEQRKRRKSQQSFFLQRACGKKEEKKLCNGKLIGSTILVTEYFSDHLLNLYD